MRKSKFLMSVGLLTAVIVVGSYYFYYPPNRVTDPTQTGFSEENFRLRYYNPVTLAHALKALFAKGVTKEYVDRILVEKGGADIYSQIDFEKGRYVYVYHPFFPLFSPNDWRIVARYDSEMKLNSMSFGRYLLDLNHEPLAKKENVK